MEGKEKGSGKGGEERRVGVSGNHNIMLVFSKVYGSKMLVFSRACRIWLTYQSQHNAFLLSALHADRDSYAALKKKMIRN